MKTRQLDNTDMQITPIGFGSWAVGGGGYQFGWGPQDDEQSIAAINHALDLGINWIDTAAVYGLGHAEEVVARALKDRSERPYIFTKCGRVWNDRGEITGNLKAQSIKRECENSLRRLQTDVIDLYQVHSPMASGLLTGSMTRERIATLPDDDWRKRDPEFQEPRLSRNLELAEELNEIAFVHNVTPGVVAIAWALQHPGVTGAIVGARRPEQVDGIIPAAEFHLTDSEAKTIEEFLRAHP